MPSMPQTNRPDHTTNHTTDTVHDATGQTGETVILGVDTHRDTHIAVLISGHGAVLDSHRFPTTQTGYHDLITWAQNRGRLARAGVEGTSSYGTALTRHLHATGVQVIEVNQPDRADRRRRGKTDTLDAEAAARAVLSGRATATAKTATGPVECVRLFKMAKDSAVKSRTQAINQLKAVLIRADPALRESLTGLSNPRLIRRCTELDHTELDHTELDQAAAIHNATYRAAAYTLYTLATRIQRLTQEITQLTTQINTTLTTAHPALLQRRGVGPDTAAALLITAGDNPDRLHTEASFAALCGASPIEMSSGKTQRHRLNRGGDRRANSALHTIVLTRLRWDTRTRDYMTRRQTEGRTRREAMRGLKRYVAREIYQIITTPTPPQLDNP
jgi:transposase